jgi:hypothetical protein
MDMRRCLVEVARYELEMLIQDVKTAIGALEWQRESVIQAIEAIQNVDEYPSECADKKDWLIMGVFDSAHYLNDILDNIMCEVGQIEPNHFSPEIGQPESCPIWLDLVPTENCQLE